MLVRAILEWDNEAQSYSATCPELNFVSSFGENREEAIKNLKDAIQLMLEPISKHLLGMN
jgi:predicted RNase H-like HicB family nuclease